MMRDVSGAALLAILIGAVSPMVAWQNDLPRAASGAKHTFQPGCRAQAAVTPPDIPLTAAVLAARPLTQVRPDLSRVVRPYPHGSVELDVGIDARGRVVSVCLVRGLRSDVDRAAIAAVQQWRYEPPRLRDTGEPFPLTFPVAIGIFPESPAPPPCSWHADLITRPMRSLGTGMQPPALLVRVEPDLSAVARPFTQGIVVVEIGVDETGAVRTACVLRGVRNDVDAAAVASVRRWRFEPLEYRWQAYAVVMTVSVAISLEDYWR
jgi:TonB family protein